MDILTGSTEILARHLADQYPGCEDASAEEQERAVRAICATDDISVMGAELLQWALSSVCWDTKKKA